MATTITGKLNKPANTFQAGESTGFGIRLGVKYRDPKTKQDEWCNYSAVIFAKSLGQIQFYQSALVEGSVVEVSCDQLKIDTYDGQNGQVLSIDMLNARLGYINTAQGAPQNPTPSQQGFQQQAPQQPAHVNQAPQIQGGFQANAPQAQQQPARDANGFTKTQGGFAQPAQQQATKVNPQEPSIDFDSDIPF